MRSDSDLKTEAFEPWKEDESKVWRHIYFVHVAIALLIRSEGVVGRVRQRLVRLTSMSHVDTSLDH